MPLIKYFPINNLQLLNPTDRLTSAGFQVNKVALLTSLVRTLLHNTEGETVRFSHPTQRHKTTAKSLSPDLNNFCKWSLSMTTLHLNKKVTIIRHPYTNPTQITRHPTALFWLPFPSYPNDFKNIAGLWQLLRLSLWNHLEFALVFRVILLLI